MLTLSDISPDRFEIRIAAYSMRKIAENFMNFPIYVSTNFWNKIRILFEGGGTPLAPLKKCHKSRGKIKNKFCSYPLI